MADTAAHLVDHVIPHVPVRQWVLSLPRKIRYILARDAKLLSGTLRIFVTEVFRDQRRRAGIRRASEGQCGSVTGIQRFGGAVNLNVHFHSMVLDGVYVSSASTGDLRFQRVRAPSKEDLERVISRARERILKFLARKGCAVGLLEDEELASNEEPSAMDIVQGASIQEWIGLSEHARKVPVLGGNGKGWTKLPEKEYCVATGDGWSLQAGVRIRAGNREGLEKLCRYILRPPFAEDRLSRLPDGQVLYEFRRPRRDGSSHMLLTPVEFLEKLAALVPPPRSHLLSYHGVLAPNSRARGKVIPVAPDAGSSPAGDCGRSGGNDSPGPSTAPAASNHRSESKRVPSDGGAVPPWPGHADPATSEEKRASIAALLAEAGRLPGTNQDWPGGPERGKVPRPQVDEAAAGPPVHRGHRKRTAWAELLRRTMSLDVLACPRCPGRMELIAIITEPEPIGKILRAMHLPEEAPVVASARPPPQAELEFVQY